MIEFQYNSFPSENTSTLLHLNQAAMNVNRLLLLIGSMVSFDDIEPAAVDRLTKPAYTQAAVKERLKLSTDREAAWRTLSLKIWHISVYERIDNPVRILPEIEGSIYWTL